MNDLIIPHSLDRGGFPEPMTKAEEDQLVPFAQAGDTEATQTLINHNARWLAKEVNKRLHYGIDREDLYQAAVEGFLVALKTYKTDQVAKLISFAKHHIKDELRKLQKQMELPHGVSRNIYDARLKIRKTESVLSLELGRSPTDQELRTAVNVTDNEWDACMKLRHLRYWSLNSNIGGTDRYDTDPTVSGNELSENLDHRDDEWYSEPEAELLRLDHLNILRKAILSLPEHEAKVVGLLYGLEDGEPKTKNDLVGILNLPEHRIYQILHSAMAKLRHPGRCFQLMSADPVC